jgi:N-acetylglutamate synthase-like GNAT family acetyltransferase
MFLGGVGMFELLRVVSEIDWDDYHAIRRKVLWEDRGQTDYDATHPDEYKPQHHALLFKVDQMAVGVARLDDRCDGTGMVRRIAVRNEKQGRGYGRMMSEAVERYARDQGIKTLYVSAAADAVGFYEKMGCLFVDNQSECKLKKVL